MSATARTVGTLASLALVLTAGCSRQSQYVGPLGKATVQLSLAPPGVVCVLIQVSGATTVTRAFDVAPEANTVFALDGLPLGNDTFTALAYSTPCAAAGAASAAWSSLSRTATIAPNVVARVTLEMSQDAGFGVVGVDFPGEGTLAPVGVDCIVVQLTGTNPLSFPFDVAPLSSTVFTLAGLPLGIQTFSAQAFATPCAQAAATSATWASAGVVTSVPGGAPANVSLLMVALDGGGGTDAGSGNDGGNGSDAGGGTDAGMASQVGRFLYTTNGGNGITAHSINAATGQLRFNGYTPVNPSGLGDSAANPVLTPDGRFLYAGDVSVGNVYGFAVSPGNGQLTSLGLRLPMSLSNLATVTAASNQQTFLYGFSGGSLQVATVDSASGLLNNLTTTTSPAASISGMSFDPQGRYAYFGIPTGIGGYAIDAGSGALTQLPGSPFSAGQQGSLPLIAISSNDCLYAVNAHEHLVHSFQIASTGPLVEVGTPQPTGSFPGALAIDPLSRYVFVSDAVASTVTAYVVQGDGSLSAQTPVPAGNGPSLLTVDPSGLYLYVAAQTGSSLAYTGVQTFAIGANGALTATHAVGEPSVSSMAILGGPTGVAYVPQFLFAAAQGFGDVSAYLVDPSTGALTLAPGSPHAISPAGPKSIATDPLGRFVYAPSASGNPASFPAFAVTGNGANAGNLTAVAGMPDAGLGSDGVVVDPSSRFAYVTNASSNAVAEYTLDATSGVLTPLSGSPFVIPNGGSGSPQGIAVSSFGATLFVANYSAGSLSALSILESPVAGALSNFTASPLATADGGFPDPAAVAVDPSNRFVYVANWFGQSIAAYQFNDADAFAPIQGPASLFATSDAGSQPTSLVVEPTGRFLYATLAAPSFGTSTAGVVVSYSIDPSSGALAEMNAPVVIAGTSPMGGDVLQGAAVDVSGRFLYAVVNNDSASPANGEIVLLLIDSSTGALTLSPNSYATPYGPTALTLSGGPQ